MKKLLIGIFFSASLLSSNVLASNNLFMINTPVGNFTDQDIAIFTHAMKKALDTTGNGKKLQWKNPETGAMGFIMPLNTTKQQGNKCREVKIFNKAKGVTGESQYQLCRLNGEWRIIQ